MQVKPNALLQDQLSSPLNTDNLMPMGVGASFKIDAAFWLRHGPKIAASVQNQVKNKALLHMQRGFVQKRVICVIAVGLRSLYLLKLEAVEYVRKETYLLHIVDLIGYLIVALHKDVLTV